MSRPISDSDLPESPESGPDDGPGGDQPGPEPTSDQPTSDQPTSDQPTSAVTAGRHLRPLVLGMAAVILGAAGVVSTVSAGHARQAASTQNLALADRTTTAQVSHQVSATVDTIFSYSYTDTARTRLAAQHLLTGQAIHQYDSLFTLVQHNAPAEKLQVTTRVTSAGVEFLTSGRARVLVFANQQDTVAGTHQSSYAGAMLAVTAVHEDGRWKIESMDTFTGSG